MVFCRKNISIIPQDPILFTGTVRENLDPHKKYADYALWNIIDRVGIRSIIPSLEHAVEDSGSSYSSGQKQLICLARAAIAKCKILILDEATANIDAVTEKLLHKVIDEIFYECTIAMIAHKLHLVMNCDKVLVMDNGNIVEFDDPRNLLNKEDSFFHKMCRKGRFVVNCANNTKLYSSFFQKTSFHFPDKQAELFEKLERPLVHPNVK